MIFLKNAYNKIESNNLFNVKSFQNKTLFSKEVTFYKYKKVDGG